jgi:outer membrane lipoprotein LolB
MIVPACTALKPGPEPVQDVSARQQLAQLETWRINGRVGVRSADESWQAGLVWNHDRDVDHLYLSGPFGQGALNIKLSAGHIRVAAADGTVEESEHPVQMLESILGVTVPVQALRYWLLGLSDPNAAADSEFDAMGRMVQLKQLGWVTRYEDYRMFRQWAVPRKLSVVNESTTVKLVIDEWHFADSTAGATASD